MNTTDIVRPASVALLSLALVACGTPLVPQSEAPTEEVVYVTEPGEADALYATEARDSYVEDPWVEVEPFNTEEYAHVDERGFMVVGANPLSTVSADVDTASFANLRRMLRDGWVLDEVPAGAVRMMSSRDMFSYSVPAMSLPSVST